MENEIMSLKLIKCLNNLLKKMLSFFLNKYKLRKNIVKAGQIELAHIHGTSKQIKKRKKGI